MCSTAADFANSVLLADVINLSMFRKNYNENELQVSQHHSNNVPAYSEVPDNSSDHQQAQKSCA